jgi:predicted methyltransferase
LTPLFVISHFQIAPLLHAKQAGQSTAVTSTDLGLTTVEVRLDMDGVIFPHGQWLTWTSLEEMHADENACFHIEDNTFEAIQGFSELTNRFYSLLPTMSAPTMLVGGFTMHRIVGTDPYRDTLQKIKAVAPIGGRVLDTTTGLGYTEIEAAKTAAEVITIELDPMAQEIARLNPWSQALFDNPKITQMIGDSAEEIEQFEDDSFSCLIHDPPMFSLGGELYSTAFYRQAYRVLKRKGRMFHYLGNPESKSGTRLIKGVMRRLREAGFTRTVQKPEAFGIVAYK